MAHVQVQVALQEAAYTFSEGDSSTEVCIEVESGTISAGQTFTAGYGSFGNTASELLTS